LTGDGYSAGTQSKPRGILRLNSSPGIPEVIASSIAEYNNQYPEVTVHLTATSRMLDLMEEGYDLAIWYAAAPVSNLIIRRLASYRMVVCASPQYLAKHGRPKHPSELTKHNSVIFYDATLAKEGKEWTFTGPDGDFQVRFSGNFETNSPIAFRIAALHGQGLIMTRAPLVADDLKTGALVAVLGEFLPKQFSVDVLYPHREHLPAKVRTFIDVVAKNLRQTDWGREGERPADSGKQAIVANSKQRVTSRIR
jgi:DNA-binding transcriptional LysR family regulator